MLLLIRVVAGHDRYGRFAAAEVGGLVRDTGRDEQKITGLVHHRMLQALALACAHGALQQVDR